LGDLHCFDVFWKHDHFVVTVKDAQPNACPTFCAYLKKYLAGYGYDVEVKTEW